MNGIMYLPFDYCHFLEGECTDLAVKLPPSGDNGLEESLELGLLLASYSVDISLWEGMVVL